MATPESSTRAVHRLRGSEETFVGDIPTSRWAVDMRDGRRMFGLRDRLPSVSARSSTSAAKIRPQSDVQPATSCRRHVRSDDDHCRISN